jgi:hypothetical protein
LLPRRLVLLLLDLAPLFEHFGHILNGLPDTGLLVRIRWEEVEFDAFVASARSFRQQSLALEQSPGLERNLERRTSPEYEPRSGQQQ